MTGLGDGSSRDAHVAATEQRPGSPEEWATIMRRQMEEAKEKHGPLTRAKLNELRMSGAVSVYVYEFLWRELGAALDLR